MDVSRRYHPGWVSHGALVGRAADAALALDGLMDGRLVGPASLDGMLEAVPVDGPNWLFGEPGYGLLFGTVFVGLAMGMFIGPRVVPDFSRRRLLGLSIVAHTIEQAGVDVTLTRAEGGGTATDSRSWLS